MYLCFSFSPEALTEPKCPNPLDPLTELPWTRVALGSRWTPSPVNYKSTIQLTWRSIDTPTTRSLLVTLLLCSSIPSCAALHAASVLTAVCDRGALAEASWGDWICDFWSARIWKESLGFCTLDINSSTLPPPPVSSVVRDISLLWTIVPVRLRKLLSKKGMLLYDAFWSYFLIPQGHYQAFETYWRGELNKAGVTAQCSVFCRSVPSWGSVRKANLGIDITAFNQVCNSAVVCVIVFWLFAALPVFFFPSDTLPPTRAASGKLCLDNHFTICTTPSRPSLSELTELLPLNFSAFVFFFFFSSAAHHAKALVGEKKKHNPTVQWSCSANVRCSACRWLLS